MWVRTVMVARIRAAPAVVRQHDEQRVVAVVDPGRVHEPAERGVEPPRRDAIRGGHPAAGMARVIGVRPMQEEETLSVRGEARERRVEDLGGVAPGEGGRDLQRAGDPPGDGAHHPGHLRHEGLGADGRPMEHLRQRMELLLRAPDARMEGGDPVARGGDPGEQGGHARRRDAGTDRRGRERGGAPAHELREAHHLESIDGIGAEAVEHEQNDAPDPVPLLGGEIRVCCHAENDREPV